MSLKSRLMSFLSYKELNPKSFEAMVGLSNGSVAKMGDNTRRSTIDKIVSVFPELNPSWLLTGEGEMLKGEVPEAAVIKPDYKEESYHLVPLINIDSVGGLHSQNMLDASEQYLIKMVPFTEAREGDVAIVQTGNSMTPTIPPGSILLLREVPEWREYFGYGNIFVLWLKDGRRVTKEIRRYEEDAKNYVWCVSHNPEVADEELPKSFIRGVWKVIKFQADFGW